MHNNVSIYGDFGRLPGSGIPSRQEIGALNESSSAVICTYHARRSRAPTDHSTSWSVIKVELGQEQEESGETEEWAWNALRLATAHALRAESEETVITCQAVAEVPIKPTSERPP